MRKRKHKKQLFSFFLKYLIVSLLLMATIRCSLLLVSSDMLHHVQNSRGMNAVATGLGPGSFLEFG